MQILKTEYEAFGNKLKSLSKPISEVLSIKKFINENLAEKSVNEIKVQYPNIEIHRILFGGVDIQKKIYRNNSFAKRISEIFGIRIDIKEYIILEEQPVENIDEIRRLTVESVDTTFSKAIKNIADIVSQLANIEIKDNLDVMEYLKNPRELIKLTHEFLEQLQKFTANQDQFVQRVYSLKYLPKFYISLTHEDWTHNFDDLKEFLGLDRLFIPDFKDLVKKENYTIYGFNGTKGRGSLIKQINETIWELVDCSLIDLKLRKEFNDQLKQELNKLNLQISSEKINSEVLKDFDLKKYEKKNNPPEGAIHAYRYEFDGYFIKEVFSKATRAGNRYRTSNQRFSLELILKLLAPVMYLGLNNLQIIQEGNTLKFDWRVM